MDLKFPTPVQCSEVSPDQPPTNPTPQVVLAASGHPLSPQRSQTAHGVDVQPDAERVEKSGAPETQKIQENPSGVSDKGYPSDPPTSRDKIVVTGTSGKTIEAEGLMSVLESGGAFHLANEINTTVYHHGDRVGGKKSSYLKNKYKLTESLAEPVIRHLDVISAGLTEDWYQLGQQLGLKESTLKQIHLDYHSDGQHEVNYRALVRWKQEVGTSATLRTLARALVAIGRGDLADELRKG